MSAPSWNGELPVIASSTGRYARTRSMTATAVSTSGTPTCTWQPQMSCRSASPAQRSFIAR